MSNDRITNWHGTPLADLDRGDIIDALDWCVKELRKHNEDYHHRSKEPTAEQARESEWQKRQQRDAAEYREARDREARDRRCQRQQQEDEGWATEQREGR